MFQNKKINIILISGCYGTRPEKIIEKLFSYYPAETFISSKSVAFADLPREVLVSEIDNEHKIAQKGNQVLIASLGIEDMLRVIDHFKAEVCSIFLTASRSIIEQGLNSLGISNEEIIKFTVGSEVQKQVFEYNALLIDHEIDITYFEGEKDRNVAIATEIKKYLDHVGFLIPEMSV